ncbi:MAG: hypothetical protein ACXV2H_04040 [Actinomycetes bacterium]
MKVYRVFAYLIAAEVIVQAAAIAFAVFGLGHWIDNGGVADKAALDGNDLHFTGVVGFAIHGINGMMIIPLLALIFLIVSFFTKSVVGGVKWAAIVFGLVVLQVMLGLFSHDVVGLGPLHGINAFALFAAAFYTGWRVTPHVRASEPQAVTV